MKRIILSFFISILFLQTLLSADTTYHDNNQTKEKVSIQLKWLHSFQFAGYYAAIEKGYYADEGLDVTLKEVDFTCDSVKAVIDGKSQYGISDSSLATYRLKRKPVVIVSQIFQHSPLVFLSHKESKITTPYEMQHKKIMYSIHNGGDAPLTTLLMKTLGDTSKLHLSQFTTLQDFIDKKVDITSAYSTSEPYLLKKKGIEFNIIDPKSYGIDFYGDNFFTTQKEIEEHPHRVAKMKRATLKGWKYALSHQNEIIDLIMQKYAPKSQKDTLAYAARGIYQMISPDLTELGTIQKYKYKEIVKTYNQLGLVNNPKIDDDFFYHERPKLQLSPKEKAWIENNPMIRLAVMDYWTTDSHGNNIHTDLIKLLNKYGNLNIVPVKFTIWKEGFEEAISGKLIHGISNLNWSKQREDKFLYTKTYHFTPSHLIVKKDNHDIKSLDDLKNKTIYLKKKIIAHNLVKDLSIGIKIIDLDSDDEIYKKLSKSKDVIATISYSVDKEKLKKYNLKIVKSTYGKYSEAAIGISHKHPELQSIINKIYASIPANALTSLQNKVYKQGKNKTVSLSKKEKTWIVQHPIVKVGVGPDWAPFDFVNSDGEYTGIANDYLNLISKKTGLKFNLEVNKWSDNLQKMKDKKIDLLHALYMTNERAKYMQFTQPYFEMLDYFFVRDDLNVTTIKDLDGKRVAIPKGYAHETILKKEFPHIKIVTVDTFSEAVEAVLENRADILFDTYAALSYVLKKDSISSIIPFKAYRGQNVVKLHMAVQKGNPTLSSIIDKGLSNITEEEKTSIYNRWISIKKDDTQVTLTSEEKEWLEQNPTAIFAGNRDRLPYIAINEQNNYIGIVADYLKEMQAYIPLTFKPKSVKNQKELKTLLQNKSIDIIPGDRENTYLAKNYRHIDSYFEAPIVILMNNDHSFVNKLEDIKHLKIAFLERRGYSTKLIQKYPSIPFIKVINAKDALEDLSLGKFDALLLTMPAAGYLIKTNNFHNIKIVGKTDVVFNLTLFVNKDKPLLYHIINKTRVIIPNIKDLEIIGKWQKIEFAKKTDYTLLFQVIGFFLFFLAGSFYWNRKLRHEIDQRQLLENSLKESEEQMRILINNLPLQVIVTAYDGKVLLVNPQTLNDYKFKKDDLADANVLSFYDNPKERDDVMAALQANGSINQAIVKFRHPDDTVHDMMLSIIPITYHNEGALLSIAIDVTKRLEMERSLADAKEEAEKASLTKSAFLTNMSHEIRTPMNAIIGFSELLSKQITNPVQKDYLSSIVSGGHALLAIINDILDLSKIEAGKMKLVKESIDLRKIGKEMQHIFAAKLIQKDLTFKIEIDETLPKYLLLDGTRVRQILFNLLGNAIKFTHEGSITLCIKKGLENINKNKVNLILEVKDSGIGIPKEHLSTIFHTFEQQKGQDNQKYGGTGLGLAICEKLSYLMNGSVSVQSEVNKGSTFTVTFLNVTISAIDISPQIEKSLQPVHFKKATVMVVDDIKDNRKLVNATLQEYGLDIVEAVDGKDAIEKLRTLKVDLVFMDIKMPIMDGYEATKIIKNDTKLSHIPIIALTASVMEEETKIIKAHDFDGYIAKPASQNDLLKQLEIFLSTKTLETTNDEERLNVEAYENLPKLIKVLETTQLEVWKEIKDKGDLSLIKAFSISLEKLAQKNSVNLLITFAQELKISCESFDIDKVNFMMNSFPNLLKKIKALKEDQ